MATVLTVAIVVYSCKSKLSQADSLDMSVTPLQTVDSMYLIQSDKGQVQMRVITGKMEKYENDSLSYELYPEGINVYAYKEDGVLESTVVADAARHETKKQSSAEDDDIWMATGNVVVRNIENEQTMETDTLYWNRDAKEIYTDSYVRMFSPDGFMQGYGMKSDERAQNAVILKPFNSYGVVVQDSSLVIVDTANFIGPLLKKKVSK